MSYYTFVFKKDDLEIQLTSTDKSEIEKQMQIWFNCVSVYAKSKGAGVGVNKEEKQVPSMPLEKPVQPMPAVKPVPTMPVEKPIIPEPIKEEIPVLPLPVVPEPVKKETSEPVKEPESFKDFSTEISEPQKEEVKEEVKAEEPVQEEVVTEEVKPKSGDEVTINNMNIPKPQKSFTELLEQQIEESTYEPKFRRDEPFVDFVSRVNIEDTEIRFGLLLKAAYYLTRYENYDRVTLKDINAKLMQNFSIIADHSVVEKALERKLIEVVPDLTGMADAAEYRLTEAGEKIFA
ncbi:hypothetical protein IJI31_04965 [bacterium]|nr:hypothetical protein [bacterium]